MIYLIPGTIVDEGQKPEFIMTQALQINPQYCLNIMFVIKTSHNGVYFKA